MYATVPWILSLHFIGEQKKQFDVMEIVSQLILTDVFFLAGETKATKLDALTGYYFVTFWQRIGMDLDY